MVKQRYVRMRCTKYGPADVILRKQAWQFLGSEIATKEIIAINIHTTVNKNGNRGKYQKAAEIEVVKHRPRDLMEPDRGEGSGWSKTGGTSWVAALR